MKYLLLVLFTLITAIASANDIDALQNDADVQGFLYKLNKDFSSENNRKLVVLPTDTVLKKLKCNGVAVQWKVKNWEKADFNGDGKTDLFVVPYFYGFQVYVVMDNGDNSFKLIGLNKNPFQGEIAKPIKKHNKQLLLYYKITKEPRGKSFFQYVAINHFDTLLYRDGGFVELNKKPAKYKFKYIKVATSGCLGSCPSFEITLSPNGVAEYDALYYNPISGKYKGLISPDKITQITDLLNYISVTKLKDNYAVNWTDDQTATLSVVFENGSEKRITDYGLQGTFGLSHLYELFFDLRLSQQWTPR